MSSVAATTHLLFDPVELLERLAALTPRPRINLVLYYEPRPIPPGHDDRGMEIEPILVRVTWPAHRRRQRPKVR